MWAEEPKITIQFWFRSEMAQTSEHCCKGLTCECEVHGGWFSALQGSISPAWAAQFVQLLFSLTRIVGFCYCIAVAVQCSSVQLSAECSTVQCSTVQCSAVQCSAVQCNAVQCSRVQCSRVQCSIVQCIFLNCICT